jgi:hypothetical protein
MKEPQNDVLGTNRAMNTLQGATYLELAVDFYVYLLEGELSDF